MSSLYQLQPIALKDRLLGHKKGRGWIEHKLEMKGDRGNTRHVGEFIVSEGAKILQLVQIGNATIGRTFLEGDRRVRADIFEIVKKTMVGHLGYDFESELWFCHSCDNTSDKYFKKCDCGEKYYYSERNLIKTMHDLMYQFDMTPSEIDAVGYDYLADAVDYAERSAKEPQVVDPVEHEVLKPVEIDEEPLAVPEPEVTLVTTKLENAWTIQIGDISVPLVVIKETPVIKGITGSLSSTGFYLEAETDRPVESEISREEVKEAVHLALEVGNEIAEQKPELKLTPYWSASLELHKRVRKHKEHAKIAATQVLKEKEKDRKIFSALESKLNLKARRKNQTVVCDRRGTLKWKTRQGHKKSKLMQQVSDSVVTQIHCDLDYKPQYSEFHFSGIKRATSKKVCKPRKQMRIVGNNKINYVMKNLSGIITERSIPVELITKRCKRRILQKKGKSYVQLRHMEGIRAQRDASSSLEMEQLFTQFCKFLVGHKSLKSSNLTYGSSGLIFKPKFADNVGRYFGDYFVVRGRLGGKRFDGRSKLARSIYAKMEQYNDVAEKFWLGFNRAFLRHRKPTDHTCTSDMDVTMCGEVAALATIIIFRCHKITCNTCMSRVKGRVIDEVGEDLNCELERLRETLSSYGGSFGHVSTLLDQLNRVLNARNLNDGAFKEIAKKIDEKKESPWTHMTAINNTLIKGSLATGYEFERASDSLREIVRWHLKRTESIKAGSVESFRNKRSGKAHFNPALTCDNQLDRNGNFLWGERQYHAKRFFANYFEKIDHSKGYEYYSQRQNPNGIRKIAIGNLIFSTNLERFRQQMVEHHIDQGPITRECIALRNNNYVHVCSCVTLDDGTPATSELKTPTKNHIVLGNSGDPKYVDLPTLESDSMYIAQKGYCYMNIFLAMLINIPENEAKDFTKRVRDLVGSKLGEWPTMLDVATCANQLIIFHPDAANAELPRILVDHKQKTMHVIDSFGSVDSGYHILKANTVNQLIQFAREPLDSEIEALHCGGEFDPTTSCLHQLIRVIYKPHELRNLLRKEPYLIVIALMSPSVLLTLFNSGAIEHALNYWIKREQDVVEVIVLVEQLCRKVTLARTILDQFNEIRQNARDIHELMDRNNKPWISYDRSLELLSVYANSQLTDEGLLKQGFSTLDPRLREAVEKTYAALLQEEWRALSLFQKLHLRYFAFKSQQSFSEYLKPKGRADLKIVYDFSPKYCVHEVGKAFGKALLQPVKAGAEIASRAISGCGTFIGKSAARGCAYIFKDLFQFVHVVLVLSILLQIFRSAQGIATEHIQLKQAKAEVEKQRDFDRLEALYAELCVKSGEQPTAEEFIDFVMEREPRLKDQAYSLIHIPVIHQAKSDNEKKLEQVIAFITLILMMIDVDKSDCVYRILNKFKGVINSCNTNVYHQSLDDIRDFYEDKQLTIDFDITGETQINRGPIDVTFEKWWDNQLSNNNTIGHYRIGGMFVEFSRSNAATVASEIAHSPEREFLVRGAVGSGKSTNLPFLLSKHGSVLLIEPTRPLCENVCKQLRGEPFHCNPTIRMRGLTAFGSTNITIMTSGFALHYYAHNIQQLRLFDFIIFDECHVIDSQAMAFYCLMEGNAIEKKILKVSATPPGREVEFSTQFPTKIVVEQSISFKQLVDNFGTGANSDVTAFADNILVYVASYNEVDQLSKLLSDKGYLVTKIDGRTMKVGKTEISTSGTKSKKHFIVATNIIENGVTLDIEAVIDFGMKVVPEMDSDNRMIRYSKQSISFGERIQRLGRVGRHKEGIALRIGHTEKGIQEIPEMAATEAAFLSFTYGLPVMTHNVGLSLLKNCTVRQARTMQQYELSPFFTQNLVNFDGTVHPKVDVLLRPYKLRDCEIRLSEAAIPHGVQSIWMSAREYEAVGGRLCLESDVRIPFLIKDVPERLYKELWDVVQTYKRDFTFGRISSVSAGKIAYTLRTDVYSIPRTLITIDKLIESENMKHAHFKAMTSCTGLNSSFSLLGVINTIQSRYLVDHSVENIRKLQLAKAQIQQLEAHVQENNVENLIQSLGAVRAVYHQSVDGIKHIKRELGLKGVWDGSLMIKDAIVCGFTMAGGAMLLYQHFRDKLTNVHVFHQGFSARQRQKLRFKSAANAKLGREVYGDDGTIEHYFGEAYTKKGNKKGRMHGMGVKTRKFVATYGFKPEDYSYVRYLDPLTGETLDESPQTDISMVQEHFGDIRNQYMDSDSFDKQTLIANNTIKAYYVRNSAKTALEVDLTPHNPLKVCDTKLTIAGFPDREAELRQTGPPRTIQIDQVPPPSKSVHHEGKSLCQGMRNYNGIASVVCHLKNTSGDGRSLFGVGYNSFIITNRHLFKENNGELIVKSQHGKFVVRNTTTLQIAPVGKTDLLIIRMPKDFPPFHSRARFRAMKAGDKVCMIGVDYQENHIASKVSETSIISEGTGEFGCHWISTNDGDCGNPLVSVSDGFIVGLHSLSTSTGDQNFFAKIPALFEEKILRKIDELTWSKHWSYNINELSWGALKVWESRPEAIFNAQKEINQLNVFEQSGSRWLFDRLHGNLKGVGSAPSNLVTKHVVKGICPLFRNYLESDEEAKAFFSPLMGHYMKSVLSKEAYIKDLMKYSSDIIVGEVDHDVFEDSVAQVVELLNDHECPELEYITDSEVITQALNMDAAVGALYTGKKRKYFEGSTVEHRQALVRKSCERLYEGRMGVWNGSLKAELRPAEKVLAKKTRSFTAAPLDTLLGAKVCVDDFNNWFYSKNMECPWTVGMTKFYKGWDEFLRRFPDGWVYCDADGSQFDSSLTPYLLNAVLSIRLWAMEDWDIGEQMLKNLYGEITYTPILTPDGTIVKKFKGNNSGQPSTVVDNTLMVLITMYYALRKAGYDTRAQEDMCVFYINGDDLCIAIHPDHEHVLDSFSSSFAELGLKYDFTQRHRSKQDLWFMSHRGILIDDIYIPKLEPERIVAILEWDKSKLPEHRLEAITAAMIESWGYGELTHQIRRFYQWVLEQAPFNELAKQGRAPYVSEVGLRRLYTSERGTMDELEAYIDKYFERERGDSPELLVYHESKSNDGYQLVCGGDVHVYHQSKPEAVDAGLNDKLKEKEKSKEKEKEKQKEKEKDDASDGNDVSTSTKTGERDRDVNAGTSGTFTVPRIKSFTDKMVLPRIKGKTVLNLNHLLQYNPQQIDISNTRATQSQFEKWYEGVRNDYGLNDNEMQVMLNGLMVWCIENGTSPDISGVWVMMDGETQVDYPIKPLIEHATPSFRQIMAHFSNAAEAYIAKRNATERYMPRYGIKRNLTDISLARYAFDFYEVNSKTPDRAREAHMQMKAAALQNTSRRLFGMDGSVSNKEENTERHTVEDVNRDMHSLLGMRN
ncbi:polyprotein [Papaya ringspot virus W]|uniref:Genome polyprotein n=2 Tax=Papaya ringspot virus TaxID=12205 RepID=B1PM22_PRSVW|nr:polyprotein [Papaya ringspot virus W]